MPDALKIVSSVVEEFINTGDDKMEIDHDRGQDPTDVLVASVQCLLQCLIPSTAPSASGQFALQQTPLPQCRPS